MKIKKELENKIIRKHLNKSLNKKEINAQYKALIRLLVYNFLQEKV